MWRVGAKLGMKVVWPLASSCICFGVGFFLKPFNLRAGRGGDISRSASHPGVGRSCWFYALKLIRRLSVAPI